MKIKLASEVEQKNTESTGMPHQIDPLKNPDAGENSPASAPDSPLIFVRRFKLNHAPAGECNAGIMVGEESEQVELVDGIFEFPKDWEQEDIDTWSEALVKAGFEDISYHVSDSIEQRNENDQKKEEDNNNQSGQENLENNNQDNFITLAHPDYLGKEDVEMKIPTPTDEDPDKVVEITLIEGVFKTDDIEFVEILKSFGFIEYGV